MFLLLRGGVTGNGIAGNFDWEAEKKITEIMNLYF